jgi:hypothetical protein
VTIDATQQLLRALDDPSRFERLEAVPVFRAHEREMPEVRLPDGRIIPKRTVRVRDEDLEGIAARLNREIAQTGHLRPLTIGHRHLHPDFPEENQPQLVGFARNYRVERVQWEGGSFLALVEDEFILRDQLDALKKYPYRSIDYNPETKLSEGTALLQRPPFLKMGTTISYAADPTRPRTPTVAHNYTRDDLHVRTMSYLRAAPGLTYEAARDAALSARPVSAAVVAMAQYEATGDVHQQPPHYHAILTYMRDRPGLDYDQAKLAVLRHLARR